MSTIAARDVVLTIISSRAEGATVCPSEVARAIMAEESRTDPDGWRTVMPEVHAAVDGLRIEGRVQLSWKGEVLEKRVGPYRLGGSSSIRGTP